MSCIPHLVALSLLAWQQNPVPAVTFQTPAGAYAVLRFTVREAGATVPAAAVDVLVDGANEQLVVLTPGVKRMQYEALLGPLSAGSHDVRVRFSPLWPRDSALRIDDLSVDVVAAGEPRWDVLANAPAIGLRPDTIGTATDLPLAMYVEDSREGASRWLRYSVIFSNEDGGTPGAALMARWGRTTDIELAYEVELRDGRIVHARYQGPDHRVIASDHLDVRPPMLVVSTLNNMFLDRGRSAAVVRMHPRPVDLSGRSRESFMDDQPWMYRVMARELDAERPDGVGNPRDYVYVDLRLGIRAAGVALGVRSSNGTTRWSDRGRPELVVSRQGEARLAIPAPFRDGLQALLIRCDPRPEPDLLPACVAQVRKVFRLGADYEPGPTLVNPAQLAIDPGTAREIPFATDKIDR